MAIEDWKGILVIRRPGSQLEGYKVILKELGINDVQIVHEDENSYQESCRKVKEAADSSDKKPLVVGLGHHLITRLTDDSMDHIYFDAHSDDYDNCYRQHHGNLNDYGGCGLHHGNFIDFMKGRHFCIGARESDYKSHKRGIANLLGFRKPQGTATLLRFEKPKKIARFPFRQKIFFSYDADVFHSSVTISHSPWEFAFFEGRMFPHQVKDLSLKIANGRDVCGAAIVEYWPTRPSRDDKTSDLFADILKPLL